VRFLAEMHQRTQWFALGERLGTMQGEADFKRNTETKSRAVVGIWI
jgi:hypothetical protein